MSIEIANIKKSLVAPGAERYLAGYSFQVDGRAVGAIRLGKTTLLRIIAGLEHQSSGHIRFHGTDVSRLHAATVSGDSYSSTMRCFVI